MNNVRSMRKTEKLTIIGILSSISIIMGITNIGFIPIGGISATIMHIPVIIGAIVGGPFVGMMIGFIFGLFSMIHAAMVPGPMSFVFLNPLISILPRVMIGLSAYIFKEFGKNIKDKKVFKIILGLFISLLFIFQIYKTFIDFNVKNMIVILFMMIMYIYIVYIFLKDKINNIDIILSAVFGSLVNTIGVLGGIYLIYGEKLVGVLSSEFQDIGKLLLSVAITNGLAEIVIAVALVTNIVTILRKTKGWQ